MTMCDATKVAPSEVAPQTSKPMTHQLWAVRISLSIFKAFAESCPEQVPVQSNEESPLVLFWYNNPHTTPLDVGQDVVVHFPFEKKEESSQVDESFRKTPHLGQLVECRNKKDIATAIPPYSQQVLRKALDLEIAKGAAVTSKKKKATITRLSRRNAQVEAEKESRRAAASARAGDSPTSTYSQDSMHANLQRMMSDSGSSNNDTTALRLSPVSTGASTPVRNLFVTRRDGSRHVAAWQDADYAAEGDCVVASFGASLEVCLVNGEARVPAEGGQGRVVRRATATDVSLLMQQKQLEQAVLSATLAQVAAEAPIRVMGMELAFDQSTLTVVYAEECTATFDLQCIAVFLQTQLVGPRVEFRRVCMNTNHCAHGKNCHLGMHCVGGCHCSMGYDATAFHNTVSRYASLLSPLMAMPMTVSVPSPTHAMPPMAPAAMSPMARH